MCIVCAPVASLHSAVYGVAVAASQPPAAAVAVDRVPQRGCARSSAPVAAVAAAVVAGSFAAVGVASAAMKPKDNVVETCQA